MRCRIPRQTHQHRCVRRLRAARPAPSRHSLRKAAAPRVCGAGAPEDRQPRWWSACLPRKRPGQRGAGQRQRMTPSPARPGWRGSSAAPPPAAGLRGTAEVSRSGQGHLSAQRERRPLHSTAQTRAVCKRQLCSQLRKVQHLHSAGGQRARQQVPLRARPALSGARQGRAQARASPSNCTHDTCRGVRVCCSAAAAAPTAGACGDVRRRLGGSGHVKAHRSTARTRRRPALHRSEPR